MSVCVQAVTLHTDLGDIKIEIFCERAPKTCEVSKRSIPPFRLFFAAHFQLGEISGKFVLFRNVYRERRVGIFKLCFN